MDAGWEGLGGPVRVDRANLANIDPTLDSCCEREEIAARKQSALQRTLQRFDVVEQRRKKHLIHTPAFDGCRCCYDPNSDGGEYEALMKYRLEREACAEVEEDLKNDAHDKENNEEEEAESDDEFDYLLDEDLPGQDEELKALEDMRRAELQFQILQRETAVQHGYGAHRQMHPRRALKAAHAAMVSVLHLYDPDSVASASLDWFLSRTLAPKNPGTKFLRSEGRAALLMDPEFTKKMLSHLQPDRDIPALIVVRDGCVVSTHNLQNMCDRYSGEILPSVIENWLERANALVAEPPTLEEICRIRPEEEALTDYLAAQKPKADVFECGMLGCEKTFPHKHIGEVNEEQDGLVVPESEILGAA